MTERYSDEELLDEIRRLADVVDGTPSSTDMREQGNYGVGTYARRFGSWNDAVERAGFEPHRNTDRIPTVTLLDDIRRVADELGHSPSITEYREHGNHSIPTYMNRFGSWPGTMAEAGLEPGRHNPIPREWLLSDLHALMRQVDGRPTSSQINSLGSYSDETYRTRFGSIPDALDAAQAFDPEEDVGDGDETADTTSDPCGPGTLCAIDDFAFNTDEVEDLCTTAIEALESSLGSYHNSDLGVYHLEMSISLYPERSDEELDEEFGSEGDE